MEYGMDKATKKPRPAAAPAAAAPVA